MGLYAVLAKVSRKGQITLPAEVRRRFNIGHGTYVRFVIEKDGVHIIPAEKGIEALKGSVKVSGPQDLKKAREQAMKGMTRERSSRA